MDTAEGSNEALRSGLESLYLSGKYSDLTIVCGDDVYPVHKAIICPRSDFFAAAVEFGKEAAENKIDLSHDEPHIVKLMIQYFYKLSYELDRSEHLYYLLPKFQCPNRPFTESETSTNVKLIERLVNVSKSGMAEAVAFVKSLPIRDADWGAQIWVQPEDLEALCMILDKNAIVGGDEDGQRSWLTTAHINAPTIHAKVYAIADKYNVRGLKSEAMVKFADATCDCIVNKGFYDAIEVVYSTTMDTDHGLRDIVETNIFDMTKVVGFTEEIENSFKENPDLAMAVLKRSFAGPSYWDETPHVEFAVVGNDGSDHVDCSPDFCWVAARWSEVDAES
ncbi:hypothetical protein DM02DRAFT_725114 [Periconia macrospinosa]|uniref:BTB domain-containing protein n=1 Tax=Periconia macrospinosa TaxID=97972 RepID=A0A2V1E4Z6_9PLEO|nr:hypothetical protein DM02DRAFT_725114 [Periconia macrospinosa]